MNLDLLRQELERDEGRRNRIYKDTAGKITGGVGRNFDDVGLHDDEIDLMLTNDINQAIHDLDKYLPWWKTLSDVRQRALINCAFNLGIFGLLRFRNTLQFLKDGKYPEAASEILNSLWARQVGARAVRIADMIRNG